MTTRHLKGPASTPRASIPARLLPAFTATETRLCISCRLALPNSPSHRQEHRHRCSRTDSGGSTYTLEHVALTTLLWDTSPLTPSSIRRVGRTKFVGHPSHSPTSAFAGRAMGCLFPQRLSLSPYHHMAATARFSGPSCAHHLPPPLSPYLLTTSAAHTPCAHTHCTQPLPSSPACTFLPSSSCLRRHHEHFWTMLCISRTSDMASRISAAAASVLSYAMSITRRALCATHYLSRHARRSSRRKGIVACNNARRGRRHCTRTAHCRTALHTLARLPISYAYLPPIYTPRYLLTRYWRAHHYRACHAAQRTCLPPVPLAACHYHRLLPVPAAIATRLPRTYRCAALRGMTRHAALA